VNNPDPVTLEVMRNRWKSIADEMCAALVRASYSTNIKDRRDCSTVIALPDGQIVAQAEVGTPLHLGVMPSVIREVLRVYPVDAMRPGEMIITNLPYPEGPGHLPDLSMVSVIHHDGKPFALTATMAHHVDMGGYAPGSMPMGVTEIYQEGLQIPPTPIIRDGKLDETILNIIEHNVRTSFEVRGDFLAQYAAAKIAERRVAELLEREEPDVVLQYAREILDHAERCMRAGIRELPDGVYEFEDFLDDDGISDDPIRIAAAITIRGEELSVDFEGTSKQVLGPLNARMPAARACVYYVCKAVIDPDMPTSAGAYRPIAVTAPEGTILNAHFPAAIGNANILTDQRVVDVLLGAMFQAAPERVCAACSGEMNIVNMGGLDPRTNEYFSYVETYAGGQGACFDIDGSDGIHTHLTNTRNAPAEVIERAYPLQVLRYELIPNSEGPGEMRGGCGVVRELRFLADRTTVSIGADRRKFTPWGLEGGHSARGAHCVVKSPDGTTRELPTKVHAVILKGEEMRIETPGGGGWGDPSGRDNDKTTDDVASGLISPSRAESIYGWRP
jgi:N-methylhydantoinase B